MKNKKDYEQILKDFVLEDECLSELSERANELNMFEVLKVEKAEIRHSNIIAWLLDPSEAHGLGASFLRELIKAVIKSKDNDYGDDYSYEGEEIEKNIVEWTLTDFDTVNVKREEKAGDRYADIVVRATANNKNYLLAIENKVSSKESTDQTKTYYKELIKENADLNAFVFLSPSGEVPKDKHWYVLTYEDIISALDIARKNRTLSDKANLILDDYVKSVKKHIIGDEGIIKLCDEIYSNHKDAIDYLMKHDKDDDLAVAIWEQHRTSFELLKENIEPIDSKVGRYIRECLKDAEQEGKIIIDERLVNQKVYIYFFTKKMTELFGELKDESSPWKTNQKYCYQFCNKPGTVTFNLELGGGNFLYENNLLEKELRIAEEYKARMTENYKFKRCAILGKKESKLHNEKLEGKTEEEIKAAVNEYVWKILEKLPEKEKEIEKILKAE